MRCSLSADPVTAEFIAYADVRTEVTDSALVEFLAEINRIRDEQVDSTELATAKAFLSGSFARSLENEGTVARFALNIERYDLPEDYYQTYLQRLDEVTIEDVQRVAKNMIKPNNLNICVVGSPDILDNLRAFDASQGIDQYDPFGQVRPTHRRPCRDHCRRRGVARLPLRHWRCQGVGKTDRHVHRGRC